MTTTTASAHRSTRVDLDVGTAPDGTRVDWQLLDGRGQTQHGLIIDHDPVRRRRTQTLIAQRARAATGAFIARLDGTWGRDPDVMWRDVAEEAAADRPVVVLIDDRDSWRPALPLWLWLARLGHRHRISLVVGLGHLGNLTVLEEPKLTSALTGRHGQWLLVGQAPGECRCRREAPRHLPGLAQAPAVEPGQALYRRRGAPRPLTLHAPVFEAPEEEFRCSDCGMWGEWVSGMRISEGYPRDEYACTYCRHAAPLSVCERRPI